MTLRSPGQQSPSECDDIGTNHLQRMPQKMHTTSNIAKQLFIEVIRSLKYNKIYKHNFIVLLLPVFQLLQKLPTKQSNGAGHFTKQLSQCLRAFTFLGWVVYQLLQFS